MNPSERFFAKLRKLTVYLEAESASLLHASKNLKDDDDDEENGAQTLYQLHSEVRALKQQVQDQVATHDALSTELRTFIRKCLVLKQRTTEDIDRLQKHYENYGYIPRKARLVNSEMNGTKEVGEREELEKTDAAQEHEEMGQGICKEAHESETPEKILPPSVDQLLTPKLSDFGLSALNFLRVVGEAEPLQSTVPIPAVALSPPPFVMNMQPPQPKTPKCSLRMDEDAPTPRIEDFGISEYTMCWNNDFTLDLFSKKPPKASSKTMENDQKLPHALTLSSVPNNGACNENLESPEPPVFCTPGFKIEKHRVPSSPPLDRQNNLDSTPQPNNCPTPEFPTFETPFVSKLLKKEVREGKSDRSVGLQEGSFRLPDLSNTNRAPSFDASEMPKILIYEEEAMPEMPTLHSHFGSYLASKTSSGESLPGKKMGPGNVVELKQATVPSMETEDGHNQDWCLSTPKMRMTFHTEPCTPEMPDISSVTQDILKLVAQCKS
ncbi:spindle and kinetochore-associated protein 3-like [Xyrauchen texanus]|uniref:spindle and kinetochore-associated protein 3-like n=1 Tax=Xyrauchen texanus TaxID=154827 RepID=UPI00224255B1|nr:spindle and kinetochore-associated protein 3-like [Xyrauchen texanus]